MPLPEPRTAVSKHVANVAAIGRTGLPRHHRPRARADSRRERRYGARHLVQAPDWAPEQAAFLVEVVESALAHTIGNKVEAAHRGN